MSHSEGGEVYRSWSFKGYLHKNGCQIARRLKYIGVGHIIKDIYIEMDVT